ncbi:hypothetical protein ABI_12660 [Asticcacaulis biprosthecium C19]|uniref:DUF2314 domain-containing protein n=1 Tax=Asticcacaulis biprosthecium C19 TaxID=715226 RepID=F4QHU1_9CAUL|nr:DUF2314 domain-containing protein [Asticcacaulis biprosthecium]EGF92828.1 hypothetical protein ABI_12660 [Asticcacaulis biprosthecium C19]
MRLVLLTAAFLCLATPVVAQDDPIVVVEEGDAAMNAAIAKARSTLPVFWAELADPKPNESDFALKIEISDGEAVEHFWCTDIVGDGKAARCAIGNDPQWVTNVKLGQVIDVKPDDISDWMYFRDGKIVGGQTIRALLPHLPPEEAEVYRNMLAN